MVLRLSETKSCGFSCLNWGDDLVFCLEDQISETGGAKKRNDVEAAAVMFRDRL